MGPKLIHLMLPLTLVPTSGMNNAINNPILININIQSDLNRKSEGMDKKQIIAITPIEIKSICLEAK